MYLLGVISFVLAANLSWPVTYATILSDTHKVLKQNPMYWKRSLEVPQFQVSNKIKLKEVAPFSV